jgi:hypothetical protein
MKHRFRQSVLALLVMATLLVLLLTGVGLDRERGRLQAAPQETATPTPTTPPVFTATVNVSPSVTQIGVGEAMRVTIGIDVSEGCQFALYESTLAQNPPNTFAYVEPTTAVVGPPGVTSYVIRARTPAVAQLDVTLYGERYCDDFWNWTYLYGSTVVVTATEGPQLPRLYFPLVGQE